jgi:hypothetical protein
MNESGTTQEKERTLQAVAAELHREYGSIDQALDAMISIVSADLTLVDQAIRDSCRRKLRIWFPRRWDGMAPSFQSTPMRVKPTRRWLFGSKIAKAIKALRVTDEH